MDQSIDQSINRSNKPCLEKTFSPLQLHHAVLPCLVPLDARPQSYLWNAHFRTGVFLQTPTSFALYLAGQLHLPMSLGNARILCDASKIHADPHEGTVANVPLPWFLINKTNCKARFYSLFFKYCEGRNSNWCQKQKSKIKKGLHQVAHQRSIGTWWAKWWSRKCIQRPDNRSNQSVNRFRCQLPLATCHLPVVIWHGNFFQNLWIVFRFFTSLRGLFSSGVFSVWKLPNPVLWIYCRLRVYFKSRLRRSSPAADNAILPLHPTFPPFGCRKAWTIWIQVCLLQWCFSAKSDIFHSSSQVCRRKFNLHCVLTVECCGTWTTSSCASRGENDIRRVSRRKWASLQTAFKNGAKDVGNHIGESCGVVLASPESFGKKLLFPPRQSINQSMLPITMLSATNQSINQSTASTTVFLLLWFNRILKLF